MVAKFDGKGPVVKKGGANKPTGEPVKPEAKVIGTTYSRAKRAGGTALLGGTIGNTDAS
jgi:hypothetical protein